MNRRRRLTDAALRAALAPARDIAAPQDLFEAIAMDIRHTPQARHPLRVPGLPNLWGIGGTARGRRLAWAVAVIALLAALVGAALIGARLVAPTACTRLTATALDALTPETGLYNGVVTDGAGKLWAVSAGHLTQFDPDTGLRRAWRLGGESVYAAVTAASREHGVWLSAGDALCRFDGNRFTDEIATPAADVIDLAEAPDGSLWANDTELGLRRWDGARWQSLPEGRPTERSGAFLALGADDVWVANPAVPGPYGPTSRGLGVSHLVDGRWRTYDARDATLLGRAIGVIEQASDGAIWVATDPGFTSSGIARFDGQAWTPVDGPGFEVAFLEAASDGSIWAAAATGAPEEGVAVAHWVDGDWSRLYLASGEVVGYLSDTPAGLLVGTDVGLFRFEDGGFWLGWPVAATGPIGPHDAIDERVLAVSASEGWLADDRGLWHFVDEAWEGPMRPGELDRAKIRALASGPDGSIWVATDAGVAVMRTGRWTTAWKGEARSVAVGLDGVAWVGRADGGLVRVRPAGTAFETERIACPVGAWWIAVATDGSVYLGTIGYSAAPGLARFDGERCELLDPLGDGSRPDVVGLAAGPRGTLVAYVLEWYRGDEWTRSLVRLDAGGWTIIERRDGVPVVVGTLAVAPNGDIWRPVDDLKPGLERYDGEAWISVLPDVNVWGPISIAPDGAVWYVGSYGAYRIVPDTVP